MSTLNCEIGMRPKGMRQKWFGRPGLRLVLLFIILACALPVLPGGAPAKEEISPAGEPAASSHSYSPSSASRPFPGVRQGYAARGKEVASASTRGPAADWHAGSIRSKEYENGTREETLRWGKYSVQFFHYSDERLVDVARILDGKGRLRFEVRHSKLVGPLDEYGSLLMDFNGDGGSGIAHTGLVRRGILLLHRISFRPQGRAQEHFDLSGRRVPSVQGQ